MGSWPRIFRDPIHGIISFADTHLDRLLFSLVNTPEFQRLRRIRQLGMCEYVFPGASHTRFAHSLGVMHLARKMLARIDGLLADKLTNDQKTVVLTAALLHDIGHGPFSHAFEKVTKINHEDRTIEIILSENSTVNAMLREHDPTLPKLIAAFIDPTRTVANCDVKLPDYLKQIVSSQLDADRFDYLLRDSHFTGTQYGQFDIEWLLEHVFVDTDKERERLYLDEKSISAIEGYVFARFHMYRSVYFHKTVRGAEIMLQLLFKRFSDILSDNKKSSKNWEAIIPEAPPTMVSAFQDKVSLEDFLKLDDSLAFALCHACCSSKDEILSSLGSGIVNRSLYKSINIEERKGESSIFDTYARIKDAIQENGGTIDYHFIGDTASDTAYKPYKPDKEAATKSNMIVVCRSTGGYEEISSVSPAIHTLTEKYEIARFYFPAKFQNNVESVL